MNFTFPFSNAPFGKCVDCQATLARLIGNLSGFLYRRRPDVTWTMEFVSAGCRDLIGYDPHRFIGNASIAFGDLVSRSDSKRVNERVRLAVLHRQRATIEYLIQTAHGTLLRVEDRFTPIINSAGKVLAIEGIIDRARSDHAPAWPSLPESDDARLAAVCTSPSSN
jgi:PAS domain-containing protein